MTSTSDEILDSIFQNDTFADTVSQDVTGGLQCDSGSLDLLDNLDIDLDGLGVSNYSVQDFDDFFKQFLASTEDVWGLSQASDHVHPIESNDAIYRIDRPDDQLKIVETNVSKLPVARSTSEKIVHSETTEPAIPLSNSVLVTVPSPSQLCLVHPLEETFRPRYKSDYFPQKGPVRRPRYVADKEGNHYATIQVPEDHRRHLKGKYLRIALITTNLPGRGHCYSPYKFQTSNTDINVPDQNPIYVPVETHPDQDYKMKLHLVLIKSKLDQLRSVQPLQPFPHPSTAVQNLIKDEHLTPKELINRYQLEKSHIAFTLCTRSPDGTFEIFSDTTVLSSVITEVGAPSSAKASPPSDEAKTVCCPKCSHKFVIGEVPPTPETAKKRKSNKTSTDETADEPVVVERSESKRKKKAA